MKKSLFIFVFMFIFCANTYGALIAEDGSSQDFWDVYFLVYGIIKDVEQITDPVVIILETQATLSGLFDPCMKTEIKLKMHSGEGSAISYKPNINDRIIVLIRKKEIKKEINYLVSSSIIEFMPNKCAILKVEGFDDPIIKNIVESIKKNRDTLGTSLK